MDSSAFTQLQWQAVLNLLAVTVIQWMKTNKSGLFSWINITTPRLTKLVSLIIATATAAGLHFHYNPTGGVITISGVTFAILLHMVKDVLQNYYGIQLGYRFLQPDEYAPKGPAAPGIPHPVTTEPKNTDRNPSILRD